MVTDLELLKVHFEQHDDAGAGASICPSHEGLCGDKASKRFLAHFRDEDTRQAFYKFFRELADLYEILSPDAFLHPYIDDYDQLSRDVPAAALCLRQHLRG